MENAGSIVNEGKSQTGFAKVKTVLGKINRVRYDNYVAFYEELKEKEKRKY